MSENWKPNRRNVLKTIGAGVAGSLAFTGSAAAHEGGLARELAEVRSATAEFNDPQNAVDAGFLPSDHAVCGMGYHWIDPTGLGSLDPTVPAVLAYGEDDDGDLVLGAVEWIVPKEISPEEPDIFDHDEGTEVWLEDSPFRGVWSLHAWVHNPNPEGVFHPINPRELFHPDECEGVH